jgi:hypothetical protein
MIANLYQVWFSTATGGVIGATLVFAVLVVPGAIGPGASDWTQRTVHLPTSGPEGGPSSCYFVNSSAYTDRFCLVLIPWPAGYIMNGSFDHGSGTQTAIIQLAEGPPCAAYCRASVTWISPDGTGQLLWGFTNSVTIGALN